MNTSSYFERPSLEASGTILPWRFIALSGDNKAAQAGNASELVMGISHEAGREAPIPNLASNPTAILDDEFAYYGGGETTFLQMAAAHPFGTKLVPDANGINGPSPNFGAAGSRKRSGLNFLESLKCFSLLCIK